MKALRLSKASHVVKLWPFFETALNTLNAKQKRNKFDLTIVRKQMLWQVTDPTVWFSVSFDDDREPVAFALAQESTAPFSTERTYIGRWFYHTPSHFQALVRLQHEFEAWAKEENIRKYAVTTDSSSGSAIRCFQSKKYGFRRSFITLEKEI